MIRIDSEEDGFWLTVEDDEDNGYPLFDDVVVSVPIGYRVRITDPEQLYELVKNELGSWIDEMRDAKAEFEASKRYGYNPDEHGGERGFEGHGDFYSDDPVERWRAHQAAKGNL